MQNINAERSALEQELSYLHEAARGGDISQLSYIRQRDAIAARLEELDRLAVQETYESEQWDAAIAEALEDEPEEPRDIAAEVRELEDEIQRLEHAVDAAQAAFAEHERGCVACFEYQILCATGSGLYSRIDFERDQLFDVKHARWALLDENRETVEA